MCDGDGIYTIFEINKRVPIPGFIQFVISITIKTEDMTPFLYIESHADEFESIKELILNDVRLYKQKMDHIQTGITMC